MKKYHLTIILLFTTLTFVYPCLNESRVLLNGKTIIAGEESLVPSGENYAYDKADYEEELKELEEKWKKEGKIEDYSDYGVVLVYLGKYDEALKVFKEIEKLNPGRYATAANMGTVFELLGENELAYEWIGKAIEIDPSSHDSSEWLHLKILEVKINGDKYLNSLFLIGTEFGDDSIPVSKLTNQELRKLRRAIYYQLNERVSFIKPKDKIIALLLFELGNICSITDDATSGLRIYEKSAQYGIEGDLFKKRYDYVYKLQNKIKPESKENNNETPGNEKDFIVLYYIISGIVILGIFGFVFWKFKKK